ncbi:hypothetical protein Salat_1505700 [Sesamum alatum]|uniref:Uncharacterized protein n=1 Tax=Sesamum alatum TaxID=300844 RepID=A0AAE2CM99_9LAMI|nr:hypothetical protein Salat_1505700 [Sesamum alatum]
MELKPESFPHKQVNKTLMKFSIIGVFGLLPFTFMGNAKETSIKWRGRSSSQTNTRVQRSLTVQILHYRYGVISEHCAIFNVFVLVLGVANPQICSMTGRFRGVQATDNAFKSTTAMATCCSAISQADTSSYTNSKVLLSVGIYLNLTVTLPEK